MANGGETSLRIAISDYSHTVPLTRGAITSPPLKPSVITDPESAARAWYGAVKRGGGGKPRSGVP